MNYNWEKIFKEKSDKELYEIFIGKQKLNEDAKFFAEKELKLRNFDFTNLNKQKKKFELEGLIEEEKTSKTFSFFSSNEKYFLIMGIFGIFFLLLNILDFFFDFIGKSNTDTTLIDKYFFILIGLVFSIVGLIGYKNKKKRKKYRTRKIRELIKEL